MSIHDFLTLCRDRYSCRFFYTERPVADEDLQAVLEAARLAPSACNKQPWQFVVVRDEKARRALLGKSRPTFVTAPVVVACCGIHDEAWHRPADGKDHTDVDLSIATEHICLAAAAAGLASCWICSFDTDAAREVLALPQGVECVALIPLGYADKEHYPDIPQKVRKPADEVISCEVYSPK